MKLTFVTGAPRSGTTLIQRMLLDKDETFQGFPECTYLTREIALYHQWTRHPDRTRFAAYFGSTEKARVLFRKVGDIFIDHLTEGLAHRNELVLKDPELVSLLPALRELFQEAGIVIVMRDPMDVLASLKDVLRRAGRPWNFANELAALAQVLAGIDSFVERHDRRTIVVRYEDITRRDPRAVARLEAFIGRPLSWSSHNDWVDKADPFYVPTYGQAVTGGRIGRFVEALTRQEIDAASAAFAAARLRWGYTGIQELLLQEHSPADTAAIRRQAPVGRGDRRPGR